MKKNLKTLAISCVIAFFNTTINADDEQILYSGWSTSTEQEVSDAARNGDFIKAIAIYERLVSEQPESIPLRLELADALKNDRRWERAISEYEEILRRQPNNMEALLGISTIRRWQGNIDEAKRMYKQAVEIDPHNPEAALGLASVYALDHDFTSAKMIYEQSVTTWPENSQVLKAAHDFRRQSNPQIYLFWETGLSFETRQGGVIAPFSAKDEVGVENQAALSFAPRLDHKEIYRRTDNKLFYTHYFGLNNKLDLSARTSEYHFNVPDSDLSYTSIDTYQEYRARYTIPMTQDQAFAIRYTARPTTLKLSRDKFTAHKVEFELDSRWTPRFTTQLGGGLLRDLDSSATDISQLTNRSLVKVGLQLDITNNLSLGAKYITNPDLDNTMRATTIVEGSYSITDKWSGLGRVRLDDYKTDADQAGTYLALRFMPNSHWWSEFGLKYEERGRTNGTYGLASINYHF